MRLAAIISILMVVLMVALAPAPGLRPLAVFPAVALVCSLIWLCHEAEMALLRAERRRFLSGLCVRCGYDLRTRPQRCPECGAAVWFPEMPLTRPGELWPNSRLTWMVPEREVLEWMLERRGPASAEAWGPDGRTRAVAATVIRICQPTSEAEPWGNFRPSDPFALISSATSVDEFSQALYAELDVAMSRDELAPYESMTVGDVVRDLTGRSFIFPRMTWPPLRRLPPVVQGRPAGSDTDGDRI